MYLEMKPKVDLPVSPDGKQTQTFSFEDLGISFPIIAYDEPPRNYKILDPDYVPKETSATRTTELGAFSGQDGLDPDAYITARGCECIVQFCWQPTRASEREEKRREQSESTGDVQEELKP